MNEEVEDLITDNKQYVELCNRQANEIILKDLEIMQLRDALENTVLSLKGYRMELSDNQPCDAEKTAVRMLLTPTTNDALMAWHNEQLGEPVAWLHKKDWYTTTDSPEFDEENWQPLYAKKGNV